MKRLLGQALLCILLTVSSVLPAAAQDTLRAVAVVNDEIVSMLDLVMRTRLVVLSSGIQNSPETQSRLVRQVLRNLIDERLQLQEAARLDIQVSEEEIDQAVIALAEQNRMSRGQFVNFLRSNDILPQTVRDRIRSGIAWQQVIARRLRPNVEISDAEVDQVMQRVAANLDQPALRVSEIFLSVDDVKQEDEVRRSAERLMDQLRAGADFSALARQFSQSATAAVGGDLGWVQEGELPDELNETLGRMRPGSAAGPIRTFSGFHILQLRDQRAAIANDTTLHLKQIFIPVAADASAERVSDVRARAADLREQITGCANVEEISEELGTNASGDLGRVQLSQLPPDIRDVISELPVNAPSPPLRVADGVSVVIVCDRDAIGIDREEIRERLLRERLEMMAQRYMRDLRRAANVDIRI